MARITTAGAFNWRAAFEGHPGLAVTPENYERLTAPPVPAPREAPVPEPEPEPPAAVPEAQAAPLPAPVAVPLPALPRPVPDGSAGD